MNWEIVNYWNCQILEDYATDLVTIKIADNEQIGQIISLVKDKLGTDYTVNKHKELVIQELTDRGYTNDIIDTWTQYIE